MKPNPYLLGAILLLGVWGLIRCWRVAEARERWEQSNRPREEQLAATRSGLAEEKERLEILRREYSEVRQARQYVTARAAGLAGAMHETVQATTWNQAPAQWPAWEPDSPFIWLSKDTLARLHPSGLNPDGSLHPDVAAVMTLAPERLESLNRTLKGLMQEFRAAKAARSHPIEEHPDKHLDQPGRKWTIQVEPMGELGQTLQQQFRDALQAHLGEQRMGILLEASEGWLSQHFDATATEPLLISVLRTEEGQTSVVFRRGTSHHSVWGDIALGDYIPAHILPLFDPILNPDSSE
ncbi:MAG: hypothetical protein KF833_01490 [Verrucomicrobiae bacterium]|nr:hypothetical protein [Verrucomicrobiae bacterium]